MDTQEKPAPDGAEPGKTVSEKILERFLDELGQQEDMGEVSERLRGVFFSEKTIKEPALRDALFNDNAQ
ncbi:MAG: hypothetical protein AAGA97_02460 [Pseudomonadota bacterium]